MGAVDRGGDGGFVAFFRSYTRTWVHAVSTAGLTAFGLLTIVNRWFVVLALAAYVVPPVALYLVHGADAADVVEGRRGSEADGGEPEASRAPDRGEPSVAGDSELGVAGGAEAETTAESETGAEAETTADAERGSSAPAADDEPTATPPPPDAESAGDATPDAEPEYEWQLAEAPTDEDLHDVAIAEDGVWAVGDGGVVLSGRDGEWTVALADGPDVQGNDLVGVDATADGEVVWVAGDSGSLGRIDADTGQHVDYTAPLDVTDNWTGVAAGGPAGDETILLINGSGQVLRGEYGDDGPSWASALKPGGGSSLSAVDVVDASLGYCCDTNDGVFETTTGGESFERVGVDGANGTLTDLSATGRGDCLVTDDDGVVYRYDGRSWTPERVCDRELAGIARRADYALVCVEDAVYERPAPIDDWERHDVGEADLDGVDVRGERAVAVGDDGAVVRRVDVARSGDGV